MRTREFVENGRGFTPALHLIVLVSVFFLGVTPAVHAKHECTQRSLQSRNGVFSHPTHWEPTW